MTKQKRPVGRPRADGKPPLDRRFVLMTAGQLMTEYGYEGTSLKKVADALGTSAPAIVQRFGNKAQLLNELVSLMADVSVRFHTTLAALNLAADVQLYKMIQSEVLALASAEHAPISLFYLPELRQPEFVIAQQARTKMMSFYREVIEQGMKGNVFHIGSIEIAAEQVFQLTETIIIAQNRKQLGDACELADQTATFALRGLLVKPGRVEKIKAAADKVDLLMT